MNTEYITKIDRNVCKNIRSELDAELTSVGKKLGVSLRMGKCTYANGSATFKLEVELLSESGRPVSREERYLNENHELLDIPKEWIGAKLRDSSDGKLYYLRGYKVRSPKRPFIIEEVGTGTRYVTSELGIKKFSIEQQQEG
tara:strand:+ start:276 stop:701 length:426 start_codon:yes stop_codon:yes gene_type:complete